MRTYVLLSLLMMIVSSAISNISAQQPALIDREIFFGNPEYSGAQISPDGKYITFLKPLDDVRNVWIKGVDEPFEKARPLTAETKRPLSGYFWSHDSKYVLFSKDNGGDENFNVYAVSPTAMAAPGQKAPAATDLTKTKGARIYIYDVPRSEPDFIYVGINDRDKAWHDLYKVQISTGKRTLILENKDRLSGYVFDNAAKLRLALRSPQDGSTEVLRIDGDKTSVIYSCGIFETCSPLHFDKANKQFYMSSNKGSRDLEELTLVDPATGKETLVEKDPVGHVDLGNAIFSDRTDELIATVYTDDKDRIYWRDKDYKNMYETIKKRLGDREISFGSSTADEGKFIVSTFSDVDPGTVWLYDKNSKNLSTLYQVREKLPRASLSEMKPITYKSSDGLEIPAYLTLPKGLEAKNLPLVVVPHGGPWARDNWGYNSFAQFLANRGYAVLEPNFRGSTGYGKKFLDAGNLQWGDKMQDDITWGVKYLVGQGTVDPKRVGIMGGSYGGYATLAGVTFTPDLYSAAVAIVAPSNLQTLLKSIPPYWEAGRVIFYKRMGDPNTDEGRKQLDRQSPLYSADKIKTPLMVVQGANDPRVNKHEADQIVVALRDRNYPVQYLLADDEGHGFQRPVNNMAMFAAAEKFLAKHLGGRFQKSMSPEVAKRLAEITVDPKNVKLVSPGGETPSAPTGSTGSVAGTWDLMVEVGGDSLPVAFMFKQDGSLVTGSMTSLMGGGDMQNGKIAGNKIVGTIDANIQGQELTLNFEATIDGDEMKGTFSGDGVPTATFTGKRKK